MAGEATRRLGIGARGDEGTNDPRIEALNFGNSEEKKKAGKINFKK